MTVTGSKRLCVKDVMSHNPISIGAGDSVRELARILDSNEISGVPVVDGQDRLIGIVSKTDLLHRLLEGPLGSRPGTSFEQMAEGLATGTDFDLSSLGTVEEFMSTDVISAVPGQPVSDAAHKMAGNGVHRVVVVDEGNHPIGMVTALDVLRVFPK